MPRYRYRTQVLTGPWRETRCDALKDAKRAGQVLVEASDPLNVRWIVPGNIEEDAYEGRCGHG